MKLARALIGDLALLGLAMLLINIAGLFTSLRSPDLATADTFFGPGDLSISEQEVLSLAARRPGESNRELVERATAAVSQGMAHDWTPGAYNLQVPLTENWVLWLGGYLDPRFQQWEFSDAHKALDRGVGLCSQHAIVLNGLLREQGLRSEIAALGYLHVVNRVELAEGEWAIADPDLGIILPDLAQITTKVVRASYASPDYYIQAYQSPIRLSATPMEYNPWAQTIERWAYLIKWLLPMLMIGVAAGGALWVASARPGSSKSAGEVRARRRAP